MKFVILSVLVATVCGCSKSEHHLPSLKPPQAKIFTPSDEMRELLDTQYTKSVLTCQTWIMQGKDVNTNAAPSAVMIFDFKDPAMLDTQTIQLSFGRINYMSTIKVKELNYESYDQPDGTRVRSGSDKLAVWIEASDRFNDGEGSLAEGAENHMIATSDSPDNVMIGSVGTVAHHTLCQFTTVEK
jgi:hypothetical protein